MLSVPAIIMAVFVPLRWEGIGMMKRFMMIALLGVILLVGCAPSNGGDPAAVMEAYLQARVDANEEELLRLSCDDWESQIALELASFESMDAELQDMVCTRGDEADGYVYVSCAGKIVTTYNGETREWPLDAFPFRMLQEGDEWKMCGYEGFEG